MKEVTIASKWMVCIDKGWVGKTSSARENTHRCNPEEKSCNAGKPEYDMWLNAKFSMESTKGVCITKKKKGHMDAPGTPCASGGPCT